MIGSDVLFPDSPKSFLSKMERKLSEDEYFFD